MTKKTFSVIFLILAMVCFLSQGVAGRAAITEVQRLGEMNVSGSEYLAVYMAFGFIQLAGLAQALFCGLSLWLSDSKMLRWIAGTGLVAGIVVFLSISMLR